MPDDTEPTPPELQHEHHRHHKHDDQPTAAPQVDKTAGDLRAEDAELDADQTLASKQGIQDAADVAALEQYKSEQLEQFPPDSDPLKDREARIADQKKHSHQQPDDQAETGGE